MDQDVHIFEIASLRFWMMGAFCLCLSLPFALLLLWRFPFADGFDGFDALCLFLTAFFGLGAFYTLGMAWHRPVGLRIDADGVSGYYAPTLRWDEISQIMQSLSGGGRDIMVELRDRKAFKARQPRWAQVLHGLELNMGLTPIPAHYLRAHPEHVRNLLAEFHARYGTRS